MKARVKKTGEIVEVYHEPQHGQIEIIYKEAVFVNGRMWVEDELEIMHEEPVSEDLEAAAEEYTKIHVTIFPDGKTDKGNRQRAFKAGAKWQKEHFEENRLKHCDSITNEQAELEQGFLDQHLDKYQRMPTFLDAIEYGMQMMNEKLMKDAIGVKINRDTLYDLKPFIHGKYLDYKIGDKVKVIVIKED